MTHALYLLVFLFSPLQSVSYDSIQDLYESDYQYEEMDNYISEEIQVSRTPVFISRPLKILENEGSTLRLPCFVDDLDGFVLLWRKNNTIIAVGDQVIDSFEERIHLEKKNGGNYLVIKQASPTDEAEYVCSVSAFMKTEIRHDVRIRVKPVIHTSPKQSLVLQEGDSAELSCLVQAGSPPPKLRWRKLLGPLPSGEEEKEGSLLKLESISRYDMGKYACEADKGFGNSPVTSLVRVEVEYGPRVTLTKSEDSRTEMKISCIVDSNPPSKVIWFKDGVKIVPNNSFVMSEHRNKYVLRLAELDYKTFGNYSCVAQNKLGKDEAMTKIAGWPGAATLTLFTLSKDLLINISVASETAVTKFKIILKSQDKLHWHEVLVTTTQSDTQDGVWSEKTRLKNSVPGTQYSASVASANSFGFSPFGEAYNFTTVGIESFKPSVDSSSSISSLNSVTTVSYLHIPILVINYLIKWN